ncbi:hypothetical protein [Flavobacterium branchiophilum]|uniref:Uncharacterized protein n=1 Tax=Flavobacterium branchiophilum TaxID=55197 RepID=A0A2H3K8G8_9FLAO|nr:hypothetical protein [Flavobacterium branchiophilum]PDS21878.1 hypothetical protein B0A77_14830 [Flavobacterium branchiophilum]
MIKTAQILILLFSISISAQVAVDKSSVSGSSTLLDFPTSTSKGIVLPKTTGATGVSGTITFDATSKMVQFKNDSGWVNMNSNTGVLPTLITTGSEVKDGMILGATSSAAAGVLVLEATDKAMVLPNVANPETNMKSPEPGTICYDTASKSIAVFNGTEWSYWK